VFSSYDLNSRGANPLKDVLAETVDFARLVCAPIKLFITATSVPTDQIRVFRNVEATPDIPLASACPPTMFPAAETGGEGGCAGNPTITSLVREFESSDTILLQVTRSNDPKRRARRARSSTGSTRSPSTPRCGPERGCAGSAAGSRRPAPPPS
jgi:NTE family protein